MKGLFQDHNKSISFANELQAFLSFHCSHYYRGMSFVGLTMFIIPSIVVIIGDLSASVISSFTVIASVCGHMPLCVVIGIRMCAISSIPAAGLTVSTIAL